jgi:hypothetical protein
MSTFVYAQLAQQKRDTTTASASATDEVLSVSEDSRLRAGQSQRATTKPAAGSRDVNNYVEALSALIPAEVLTLHALILSATTTIRQSDKPAEGTITTISDPQTLKYAFAGLIALSFLLYVVPRIYAAMRAVGGNLWLWLKQLDVLDWARASIPPLAFVGWSMLQRATAFDAAFPWVSQSQRTVAGLFLGTLLIAAASWLAFKRPPR